MQSHSNQKRLFWVVLLLIVAAAAVPRLLIYDFSLPYIDHPDEPNYYLEALKWRGLYEPGGEIPGYPPAFLAVNWGVQQITEAQLGGPTSLTIRVLRLGSVAASLLTLVTIALTAQYLAGPTAGWFAAVPWAISPIVVTHSVYATADPYVYLFVAVAVGLALVRRPWFALWSVLVGLVAVVFKYPALPVLSAGVIAALFHLRHERRLALRVLGLQIVAIVLVAGFLFLVYGANQMDIREAESFRESGLRNLLSFERVFGNIWQVFEPLNAYVAGFVIFGIGLVTALSPANPRLKGPEWLILLVPLLGIPWLASSYSSTIVTERTKDLLPATTIACSLFGVMIVQGVALVPGKLRAAAWAGALLLIVAVNAKPAVQTATMIADYRLPDTRVAIRQWADVNLEPGTVVVDQSNHKTFNPFWGGIEGRQWFDWWLTEDFTEYSLSEWRDERGMSYMAVPVDVAAELPAAYTDDMLLLRRFDPAEPVRGPHVAFYSTQRMAHERDIAFGETIRLVGYDGPATAQPGDTLTFRFYWQADATPPANYSVYLHLTPANSREVIAQADGAPAAPERPTVTWEHPSEVLISQPMTLTVPPDLETGTYRVIVGLYDFNTFERLPVGAGELGDGYELFAFTP